MSALALGEAAAVALGVAYLLLAVRQNILCWYAAFLSTAISVWLFWNVSLLMESGLNVYYMAMAVYGWHQWKFGGADRNTLRVSRWRPPAHVTALALIFVMTVISGKLLATNTGAAWPYLDSFTTWASVLTTFMVARKILENWIYWIVIDLVSIFLYADRGLYLYAALFAAYVVIAVFGYLRWRRSLAEQVAA
jgi:nicotinamide mononucleotide transporter